MSEAKGGRGYKVTPSSACDDPKCDCGPSIYHDPLDLLRFLSGRLKYAGASHDVLRAYARDIDATLAALNTRSSLLGMVPEGWEFADPFPLEQVDGAWRANIRKRNGQFWTAAYGTGLTPESAVTDAASKVKP